MKFQNSRTITATGFQFDLSSLDVSCRFNDEYVSHREGIHCFDKVYSMTIYQWNLLFLPEFGDFTRIPWLLPDWKQIIVQFLPVLQQNLETLMIPALVQPFSPRYEGPTPRYLWQWRRTSPIEAQYLLVSVSVSLFLCLSVPSLYHSLFSQSVYLSISLPLSISI